MTKALPPVAVALIALCVGSVAHSQETTRASVSSTGAETAYGAYSRRPAVSADGWVVAFESIAPNLVAADHNLAWDVFVHDRATGITERVSVDSFGVEANGSSYFPSLSADGQYVAFVSDATNLVVGDGNGKTDVFVHDRVSGSTVRVSVDSAGVEGNGVSGSPILSGDGQLVVFESDATNLVANDQNATLDAFLHDMATAATTRVSVDSAGTEANGYAWGPTISRDGNVVAFTSGASNLVAGDTNKRDDVFVKVLATGQTTCVSRTPSGATGNGDSYEASLSADGALIAYGGWASNLVAGDTNFNNDIFVHDRSTGITERVSVSSAGAQANGGSFQASVSADGRFVSFESAATNLVAGDLNASQDVFIRDRTGATTSRVSLDSTAAEGNAGSTYQGMSADGFVIVFQSSASNLVANDGNDSDDVFVHERCERAAWSLYGSGFPGTNGVPALTPQANPILGTNFVLDIGTSAPSWTIAAFLVGLQPASIPLKKGGDLLVLPIVSYVFALPPTGTSFAEFIEDDPVLYGLPVYAQTLIVDPGAAKGQSVSAGLALTVGH